MSPGRFVACLVVAVLVIDLLDYLTETERRLRALERDGNVIRGPWTAVEREGTSP